MEINEQYQAYPDPEPKEEQKSKQSGSSRDRDMMGSSAKNLLSAEVEVVKDDKIQISESILRRKVKTKNDRWESPPCTTELCRHCMH
jgi:hypothetical protein